MASLALSFSLDTSSDRSLLLHRRGSPRRRTSHFPSLNPRVVFVGLAARVERRVGFVVRSGEGEAVGDDDEVTKAIEKSKKALALQKGLLEQIVERRKLVSSIKDSKIDNKTDISSGSKEDKSLPEANKSPKSTYFSRESPNVGSSGSAVNKKRESVDKSPVQSLDVVNKRKESVDKSPVQSSVAVNNRKESADKSPVQSSVASALGLRRETDSAINESKKMTSSLQKTAKPDKARTDQLSTQQEKHVVSQSDSQESSSEEGSSTSPPLAGVNAMNVILVAAECSPWIKTGGLGDVAGALPKALAKRGHRVMVVVPRYGNYAEAVEVGQRRRYKIDGQDMEIAYYHTYIDGVDFVFIDSPILSHRENNIYGGERKDILKRMVLFCKAAIEVPWHVPCGGVCYGDGNLVFIANDWHTALLPVYLKAYYRDNGLMTYTRSVLVIHNIAHQGRGPVDDFAFTDLPGHYIDLFKMDDPVGGEHFNIFAAGLKTADRIVTVSHGYTRELKTLEGGWGLHNIINENDWKLQGIVNGIDVNDWNPEIDVHLQTDGYSNYSIETLKAGKGQCKAALQRELGLPVRNEVPVIGFIGRLDHQKGVDLIAEALPWMVSQDMQLIMLGTGRQDLEEMLRRFEGQHHEKVRSWVGFSVKTSHRITAGADILLMPSRFEPCGLNQLYAMKYGTIPVVHSVGGLRDTVQQFDPFNESGYGWTFDQAESGKLIDALGHSLNTYWNYKESWEGLQRRGMQQDLSWDNVAQHYEDVLVKAKYQW